MAALKLDFGALADEQRNVLLCLLHPPFSDLYRDPERVVREGIASARLGRTAPRTPRSAKWSRS
jgi:hypothetical protein